MQQQKPNIYDYLEYRSFLRDMYTYFKSTEPRFSFRAFSQRAGFSAPNTLKLIMDGQRGLTDSSFRKVCKGVGLDNQEKTYFRHLVDWDTAKTNTEREHLEALLARLQRRQGVRKLDSDMFAYLSTWIPAVIRELLGLDHAPQSAKGIRMALWPKLTVGQIEEALNLLRKLGLLKFTRQGWRPTQMYLETPDDIRDIAARGYHRDMLALARESLDALPQEQRNVGALTASIHHSQFAELAAFMQEQRRQMLAFVQELQAQKRGDQIVQVNYQVFPLSKRIAYKKPEGGSDAG